MNQIQNTKQYDLEDRTLEFGKRVIRLCKSLIMNPINLPIISQLMRSGTSVGANYREANETSIKKDFLFRMRICRKEAKETIYWLKMVIEANSEFGEKIKSLLDEANQLVKIFATIIIKSKISYEF